MSYMSSSRKSVIEQAILRLGPGAYQNLLEDYLRKKYKYKNTMPLGTNTGTDKTTPGTPDTIVRAENGKYILINYGTDTHNSFSKIKEDILSCLDEKKTKISTENIEQIICCHTSTNLNAGQLTEIYSLFGNIELIGISDLAYDLIEQYQSLAYTHLGIKLNTHQISSEEDFIKESDKNTYSTTLDMPLLCRDGEMTELLSLVETEAVVLVSGPSEIGKTRLAMEVARRYAERHNATLRFIKSNAQPIYNDLVIEFSGNGQYIVVVDDANRLEHIRVLLSMVFDKQNSRLIKLILTARDYTKDKLIKDLREICIPTEFKLSGLSEDDVTHILQENMNIKNFDLQRQIRQIAKGNIRIAIMAAMCAKAGKVADVNNSFEILRNYYDPIVSELDRRELVVASIVAFFDAFLVDKDEIPFHIAANRGIDDGQFIDCCLNLAEKEVIATRENKAIKFDNQNLQDYFLYYALFEAKLLSPSELIISSFEKYRSRVVFVFTTLIEMFQSEPLMEYLESEIKIAWAVLKANEPLIDSFIEAFIHFIPDETLLQIRHKMEQIAIVQNDLTTYDYEKTSNQDNIKSTTINLLSRFRHSTYYEDAIDIAINYFERNNEFPMDFYHLIKNRWGYERLSCHFNFVDEHLLLDKLIENYQNKQSLPAAQLLYFALIGLTQYKFETVEPDIGNRFTFFRAHLPNTEALINLRTKCIEAIYKLFSNVEHRYLSFRIMKLGFGGYDLENENDCAIAHHDMHEISLLILPLLDNRIFEHCTLLERFEKICRDFDISHAQSIPVSTDNPVYDIYVQMKKDRGYRKQEEDEYDANICKMSKNITSSTFAALWKELKNYPDAKNYDWQLNTAIQSLFGFLKEDHEKFIECFTSYAENNTPYCYYYDIISDGLMEILGWQKSLDFIRKLDFPLRNSFLASLYDRADLSELDKVALVEIMEIAVDASISYNTACKINSVHSGFFAEYLQYLAFCSNNNSYVIRSFFASMRRATDDAYEIISLLNGKLEILYSALLPIIKAGHADYYVLDILISLVCKDISYLQVIVKEMCSNKSYNRDNMFINKLWELDGYMEYITEAFEAMESCCKYVFLGDSFLETLISIENDSTELTEKKLAWQRYYISNNHDNTDSMNYLFFTVCNCPLSQLKDALLSFCECNKEFESFKRLPLLPTSHFWSGSEIPHIESELRFLVDLKSNLKGTDYIEHRIHIGEAIQNKRMYKERVLTREFLGEL